MDKMATTEMHAAAHGGETASEMRASAPAANVHSSAHTVHSTPHAVHSTSHAATMHAATAASSAVKGARG